ncbi:hypothetical protein AB0B01_09200 [Streptomyces sp. NPDC044571]|uniref:hypothetical protein n=1 Tax=Streptomyces sp. NPDC044571 TaxID=3155371 RepID=UPI003407383E
MSQRLRAQRWLAGAALAAAALVPTSSSLAAPPARTTPPARPEAAAPLAATAVPTRPDPVADVAHEAYGELAGSVAGVGRRHPGRPEAEPANPESVIVSRPVPARPQPHQRPRAQTPLPRIAPSPPQTVTALGTGPNERAADLAAHLLPLGTGFALMGVGLGYLGVRLRRGA